MVQQADLLPKSDEADMDGPDECPHTQWMAFQENNSKVRKLESFTIDVKK